MFFSGLFDHKTAVLVHGQKRLGQHGCPLRGRNEMPKTESLMFVRVTAMSAKTRFLSS